MHLDYGATCSFGVEREEDVATMAWQNDKMNHHRLYCSSRAANRGKSSRKNRRGAYHYLRTSQSSSSSRSLRGPIFVALTFLTFLTLVPGALAATTVTTSGGTTAYTEGNAAGVTKVDATLTVTSDSLISSALIKLTTSNDGDDALSVSPFNGLSQGSGYDSGNKQLTVSGLGTAATYQSVLRTVSFYNPSSTPQTAQRTVTFSLYDSDGVLQSTATKQISMTLVDNVPSVTFSSGSSLSYTERQGALVLDSGMQVVDPDSSDITEATFEITSGYDSGKDVLSAAQDVTLIKKADGVTPAGLTSTFDAAAGKLTISGTASKSTYQGIVQKVTFDNTAYDASATQRQITIKVKDLTTRSSGSILTIDWTAVVQAPVLTGSSTTFKWVEGSAGVFVDDSVGISDLDSTELSSATVTISSGYDGANGDVLSIATGSLGGLSSSFASDSGKLTLSGTKSLAVYQSALRSVKYENSNEKPTMGNRVVSFQVNDGLALSNVITRTFTVTSVNDKPTLAGSTSALSFNGLTVTLQDSVVVGDPDDANLSTAVAEITSGCLSTDVFSTAVAVSGILMDTSVGCKATFSGSASKADYQTLLRGLRLTLKSGTSSTTFERQVKITVSDGTDSSDALTRYYYALDNLPTPTVTSTTSPPTNGGSITITGTNFGPSTPNLVTKVQLGMGTCTNIVVTTAYTKLTCDAPAGTGKDIAVVVTVGDKKSTPFASFTYQSPTVTSITSVPTAGGTVTITGTNFGPTGSASLGSNAGGSIVVAGKSCTSATVSVAHTTITCSQLEGTGGSKDVTVTVATLSSGTTGNGKFSYSVPSISTKAMGSFLGYTTVFTGTNFGPKDTTLTVTVTLNGGGGTSFTCASATVTKAHEEFSCTMPAASTNPGPNTSDLTKLYDVQVVCDGLTGTGTSNFQYEGPVITSVGTVSFHGAEVTITGRNFGPLNQAITRVNIGSGGFFVHSTVGSNANDTPSGKCTPKTSTEHTTICAYFKDYKTTGNSMTPTVSLVVGGQTSNTFTAFSYEGPVITGTSTGSQFGGGATSAAKITITGRNFGAARTFGNGDATYGTETLSIGGTAASGTNEVVSDTVITATASPASGSSPKSTQNADIALTLFDQTSTGGTGKFSYVGPIITTVSSVVTAGGTLTITGDNFGPVKATADYFNTATYATAGVTLCANAACSSTIACTNPQVTTANTKITCVMGAGVPINTKVTVKMFDGTLDSGTTGNGKLVVSNPTATSMTPAGGVATTGGEITVTGTSFGPAGNSFVSVKAGTYSCTSVTVVSHTSLKCTVPAGFGGNLNLEVKLTNGDSITSAANTVFKYATPTVTSVTSVDTAGGTVTITGTNFGPLGSAVESVTLNSAAVNNPSITVAHTQIVGSYTTGGTGTGYPAIVTMGGQASATNTLFSYNGPTVTSVTTAPSIFGGSLVVAGTNLGPTGLSAAKISVVVTGDGTTTCSSPSVSNHNSVTCTITCSTVCNDATRDVTVTIDGQNSGTSGNGKLKYEGPVITGVPAVSYHGVRGNTPVVITGRNFGDGTYINSIKMCKLDAISKCSGTASGATYGKEFETATTVSVVTSGTQIQGFFKENIGDDFSLVVSVNNIQSTGGDGILDLSGPTITVDSSNLISTTVPTAGGTLTVAGTNFGPLGAANLMKIVWDSSSTAVTPSGSSATVSTANTQITFTAPAGAGTKTFSFTISVNGTTAGSLATNAAQMKYVAPNITSVTSSSTAGGTVTITGTNFGPVGTSDITSLKLTTDAATSTQADFTDATVSVANTKITATAPAGSGKDLAVTLVIGGQTATNGDTAFTYSAPAITSAGAISTGPTWTTTGYGAYSTQAGAWVTITGTNFGPSQALTALTIGGVACANPFVTVADTQIMCLFGPGAGKDYDIVFSVNGIDATGGTGKFGYSIPLITSSTTTSYFGGETVTITGTNFGPAAGDTTKKVPTSADPTLSVTIGGNACTSPVITVGHTTITCTAPAYLDQSVISGVQVAVTVQGQTGASEYTYSGPTITTVSDVSMFGGSVTVTGTNFGPVGDANIGSLYIGGIQQSLTTTKPTVTKKDTEIVFTSASGTGSKLNVQFYIRGQNTGTTGNGLMSFYGPRITSVGTISTQGGTVTITGEHFGDVGTAQVNFVTIDGVFCTNAQIIVAKTTISCDYKAGTGKGYNVVVKLNGESSQSTGDGLFGYNLPTVTSVTPSTGGLGTKITVKGIDFGSDVSLVKVYLMNDGKKNYCTNVVMVENEKTLTCDIPLGTGANQIVYVEVNGVVNTDGAKFTYGTPTVTSVTNVGPLGGTITVTGTNFGPLGTALITSVKFGSATCASASVVTAATTITCTMPKAQITANGGSFAASDLDGDGLMDVVATIDGIASTGGTNMFKFDQPTISQITPTLVAKMEEITIKGSNFGDHKSSVILGADSTYKSFTHPATETNVTTITNSEIVMKVPTGFGTSSKLSVFINGREADYSDLASRNVDFKNPTVVSTESPSTTEGGQIKVTGTGFGPKGQTQQLDSIVISSSVGAMTCTNTAVTVEDTTMTCDVLPGTGAAYNVTVTVASQDSGGSGEGKFSYPPPEVTSVAPSEGRAGDQIVVTGKNFGTADNTITVKMKGVGDDSCGGIPCLSSTIVKGSPHIQALCVVPTSIGKNVPVVVEVNGQSSNGSTANSFSYANPIIGTVTTSKSEGSAITITGQNFGPAGECYQNYFESIKVGTALCTDSMVKKSGTEIVCMAPPGVGKDHDVVVTMRGASSGDSGVKKLSYLPPVVSSASYVPTSGGTLTIAGDNFGPVPDNTTAIEGPKVTITSSAGTDLPCKNITVATAHKEITCEIAKGTGGNYSIVVEVGSQNSGDTGNQKMSYHPPEPQILVPLEQREQDLELGNTMITVTGKNFGDDYNKLKIRVGDVFAVQDSLRMFFIQNSDLVEVIARVPAGAGSKIPVTVIVDGVESVDNPNITFSYLAPYVTGSTPVGTAGGETEIYGGNFGPNGTVPHLVTLGGVACANPLTTENSTIRCNAPAGVGKDLDVFIQIGQSDTINSTTSGAGKFRYICPLIEAITASVPELSAAGPQTVTVTGTNFGNDNSKITAKIRKPEYILTADPTSGTYFETNAVTLDVNYGTPNSFTKDYRLEFTVPPGFGNQLPIVIDVAGQDSASNCAIPKALPIGDNLDYSKLFSYSQPRIDAVSAVPTSGGTITLTGKYFGPVGTEGLGQIYVNAHDGRNISCTSPKVTKADTEAQCEVGPGVGSNLPISIVVGGYASITKNVFSYALPSVTGISPGTDVKGGDIVTVTGINFGTNSSLIALSLLKDMKVGDSDQIEFSTVVTITKPHKEFTFIAPTSTGKLRGVQVILPKEPSADAGNPDQHRSFSQVGLDEPSFTYKPPKVSTLGKVPTSGGVVTVTGTGFGTGVKKANYFPVLVIGGNPCNNLNVVTPDSALTCQIGEGTGGNNEWTLTVDGQSDGASTYSYQSPEVSSVLPTTGSQGATITVAGQNFGSDAANVIIGIGNYSCTDVFMVTKHSKVTCRVPKGEGINVDLTANVSGLVSPPAMFSFTLFGCTDKSAQNYNPLATVLDSSCIFLGCTNAKSVNFDSKANKDNGSCILDPVKVTMKVKLDFKEYLKEPEFHQNIFKDDLSKNLGIDKSRIMILGATEGSTVFDFYIIDDPKKPAKDVASNLQEKIVSNKFAISYPVVEVTMKSTDDSLPETKITTKEGEPRVSMESIIGIAACTGFILIWALTYRACFRFCARCCGPKEKAGKVMPAPAQDLYPQIFPSAQGKINYGVLQNV